MQIFNLQLLRAFAALNVVFFHVIGTSDAYGFSVDRFEFLTGWGQNGVDIFFVISGFIMVYVQNIKNRTPRAFIIDRVVRLVPVYWLFTSLLVVSFIVMPSAAFNSSPPGISELVASLLFVHQPLYGSFPLLYVGWSLEYEMLFYLIFAICIIFGRGIHRCLLIFALLFISQFFFGVGSIIYEFFMGVLIGYFHQHFSVSKTLGALVLIVGAIGLAVPLFSSPSEAIENRFILYGLPSSLIVFGAIYTKQLGNSLLILLGDSSYSIYLAQVFTVPLFYKALSFASISGINTDLLALLCVVSTGLVGVVSYLLFEKPVSVYFRKNTTIL